MSLSAEKSHEIHFVTGKGGVGKSLTALALANQLHAEGFKTLLVEIGDSSYFKDFINLPSIGHIPKLSPWGFDIALWSGESCLRDYVLHLIKIEQLYRLFFENKVMRSLIQVAPGLVEVAILGKLTSQARHVGPPMHYERIVVDCFATGHAIALFRAPIGMLQAVQIGPMGHHCRDIVAALQNPKLTKVHVVTLLEELPVAETLEFVDVLKHSLKMDCDVIANKVLHLPEDFKASTEAQKELADYFLNADHRQKNFLVELKRTGLSLRELPMVFSYDPQKIAQGVGGFLRKS